MAGVLGDDPELGVGPEGGSVGDALVRLPVLRPDVVVLDLPGPDVLEIARRFRMQAPRTAALVLQGPGGASIPDGKADPAAPAVLRKPVRGRTLVGAVHAVAAGAVGWSTGQVTGAPPRRPDLGGDRLAGLTERERAVLREVAAGQSNKQIARSLQISERTVKYHVTSLLTKSGADNRAQAVALAFQRVLL